MSDYLDEMRERIAANQHHDIIKAIALSSIAEDVHAIAAALTLPQGPRETPGHGDATSSIDAASAPAELTTEELARAIYEARWGALPPGRWVLGGACRAEAEALAARVLPGLRLLGVTKAGA